LQGRNQGFYEDEQDNRNTKEGSKDKRQYSGVIFEGTSRGSERTTNETNTSDTLERENKPAFAAPRPG
jgi:hypothetical protein